MDLQVSRENKAAALQVIRYVQLLTLSQIIPTITIKMINIIAGKKYHSRRRAFKIYALSTQEQIPLSHSVAKPSVHQEVHPTPQQSATFYSAQQQSPLPQLSSTHPAAQPSSTSNPFSKTKLS
jgi:hypothetical protein